jgi:uncharacterized protein (DUF983 family)
MKLLKGSKVYSIFAGVCPVCHQGKMYKEPNPYKMRKLFKMNERCSFCGLKFKMEPSFFFGAMYVSYGIGVAISVALFIITYYFIGLGRLASFFSIIGGLFFLYPVIIRLSRNIWINFFLDYDPSKAKLVKKND